MNKNPALVVLFFCCIGLACGRNVYKAGRNYVNDDQLMGCIRITSEFYMDQHEITTFNWREYMYWTARVFGEDSPEFAACKPDAVALKRLYQVWDFEAEHFGTGLQVYPMVGISQAQAEAFSKWRSDRVFEYLLIRHEIVAWNPYHDAASYFTIERYFKGEYNGVIPDPDLVYYPVFSLPTPEQFGLAIQYSDSVNCRYFDECRWSCFGDWDTVDRMKYDQHSEWLTQFETKPVDAGRIKKAEMAVLHLYGNVAEWSAVPGMTMGGGWNGQMDSPLPIGLTQADAANAWTGFRNVMVWQKWEHIDYAKILERRINEY